MISNSKNTALFLVFILFGQSAFAAPAVQVYCPLLMKLALDPADQSTAWRLTEKTGWREPDAGNALHPERRVKIRTNISQFAGERNAADESADAAAPFRFLKTDSRPAGMPAGTYWSNSGRYFYYSPTIESGLKGGEKATERLEFVFQHKTPSGKIVEQTGGYSAPDSSWGWDGRFELQPTGGGHYELVVTQGAMELPTKMRGTHAGVSDLPEISKHNASRSRHIFKPVKFENGKLYLMDEGSILKNVPDINGDWISYEDQVDATGKIVHRLTSAHGYGENFIPLGTDPRKMATDEFGYPIRIFDMVTAEVHIEREVNGVKTIAKVPATTRSIAYRMDPKNPSHRVSSGILLPNGEPADAGIVIMAEDLPEAPGVPVRSTYRMADLKHGEILELRTANMNGTVSIEKNYRGPVHATLVEGFNPVPGVITFPSGAQYYLGTFSASEYTAGALPAVGKKEWRYGSYIGFRPAKDGPLGRYRPATEMTEHGLDFSDALEDFTELYALSWGAGRPQAYQDEAGKWWLDVHFVDTDLLDPSLPKSGYPARHEDFASAYRRHKASLPIRWTEKNGQPWFEIDDPVVHKAIQKFRSSKRRRN